tara:strand:- start:2760 stop:3380 length:621 start_codon:yes stop_codon:yes gene_type:complete
MFPANAKNIGLTLTAASIDTDVTDDIDSNGSIDTTKAISNDVFFGSIFLENSVDTMFGSLTFGVDLIPLEAEFESRSTTQVSLKDTSTTTSGTNSGNADVSKHLTFYIQPAKDLGNGLSVFGTLGYVTADVSTELKSVSSTDKTVDQSLDGVKLGVGIKKDLGGQFIKLEYSQTDYDDISATTSNSTKVTADIDTAQLNLSIGKQF